jgi:hypothetical protein
MKMHSPGHSSALSITASSLLSGKARHTFGTLGVPLGGGIDLVALTDVGEAIVEQGENVGRDLFTEAITSAQILVDPHLHSYDLLIRRVRRG